MQLTQQISEKNAEIESLITNLETRKQQISQLEKILLTLEDQTRKASAQKRKDQEKIRYLENKIAQYETYHMERKQSLEAPAENLDSFMKILEDELGTPVEQRPQHTPKSFHIKKSYAGDVKHAKYEYRDGSNRLPMYEEHERMPTKITADACAKKACEYQGDNLDRKKANTNLDTQKYDSILGPGLNVYEIPTTRDNFLSRGKVSTRQKDIYLSRNLNFLTPIQFREDKKCKMYKFAGHRL